MARPWMPLYVADYLADTGHLSAAEHGAYLLLIMHYWSNGGLPNDDKKLARIARMSDKEWRSARDTVADFFGEGWRHERIESELSAANASYERRALAGRKGAMPRQAQSNAVAMLQQCRKHCSSNHNHNQISLIFDQRNASGLALSLRSSKLSFGQLGRTRSASLRRPNHFWRRGCLASNCPRSLTAWNDTCAGSRPTGHG